jgi:hypothetical protein
MGRARDLIDKFGREEGDFLKTEFLAPVGRGATVRVRIAGMVCELAVKSAEEGIAHLRPRSHREAEVVRPATRTEVKKYLDLFPRARVVVTYLHGGTWLGIAAAAPAKGIDVQGWVPIALGKELRLFQTAVVRFDSALFLLESTERPAEAQYLRDELRKATPVDALKRKGLTEPERRAYAFQLDVQEEMAKSADHRRLERSLKMAGAELQDFHEKDGTFTVSWKVDGRPYRSIVAKNDLTVISSGICLSDQDSDFDLTSLVSVMRQHHEEGHDH